MFLFIPYQWHTRWPAMVAFEDLGWKDVSVPVNLTEQPTMKT